jgi:hypothetical protein
MGLFIKGAGGDILRKNSDPLTIEEVQQYFETVPAFYRDLYVVWFRTGWRPTTGKQRPWRGSREAVEPERRLRPLHLPRRAAPLGFAQRRAPSSPASARRPGVPILRPAGMNAMVLATRPLTAGDRG